MSEHHDDINPAVQCSDVGGDPSQLRAIYRSSTRWHVQAIGASAAAGCRGTFTNGVDGQKANSYAVSLDDHRATGCGQVSASPDGLDAGRVEAIKGLAQRPIPVVTDVIVGQGQQVESSSSQPRRDLRTCCEGVAALGWWPCGGQGRLEVADCDLCGSQSLCQRLERRTGISAVAITDPTAKHDVADGGKCGDFGYGSCVTNAQWIALRLAEGMTPADRQHLDPSVHGIGRHNAEHVPTAAHCA
jgi:hypothetical protein